MSHTEVPLDTKPISVCQARDATRSWLRGIGRSGAADAATLIVSELVANSVVHGREPIALHLWEQECDRVRIGVSDGSTTVACNEPVPTGANSGRGMHLVESFASGWGTEVREGGKLTWAELPAAT